MTVLSLFVSSLAWIAFSSRDSAKDAGTSSRYFSCRFRGRAVYPMVLILESAPRSAHLQRNDQVSAHLVSKLTPAGSCQAGISVCSTTEEQSKSRGGKHVHRQDKTSQGLSTCPLLTYMSKTKPPLTWRDSHPAALLVLPSLDFGEAAPDLCVHWL